MGNIIVNNTAEGAILDIEVFGNTYQNPDSLEVIQSVGTLREDGLYEFSILSTNGKESSDTLYQSSKSLVVIPCQLEKFEDLQDKLYYDKAKKLWCINKVAKVVYEDGILVNKQTVSEIIELPLDTYIQLNSFLGDTHVFTENTIIKPTIKAKISKSLAASVSSINSKSDILSDRIDNIIDKIGNTEGSGLATQEYVDQQDGLTLQHAKDYTDTEISKINNLNFQVVQELPETGESNIIYLLPNESSSDNLYMEYIWLDGKWEIWGSASVDLSSYATKEELLNKSDVGHNHDDIYYQKPEVDEFVEPISTEYIDQLFDTVGGETNPVNYYTKNEIDEKLANIDIDTSTLVDKDSYEADKLLIQNSITSLQELVGQVNQELIVEYNKLAEIL